MASSGLKRPLEYELPLPHNRPGVSNNSLNNLPGPLSNVNKKRCMNFTAQPSRNDIQSEISGHHHNLHDHQNQQPYNYHNQDIPHQQPSLSNDGLNYTSPFRDPSSYLNPIAEEITNMIRNEAHRSHQEYDRHQRSNNDGPLFTMRQTQLICEKLIKDRERKLREEYDKILITKLSEQYDTFVKYTQDNIEKRYNNTNSHQVSYLS